VQISKGIGRDAKGSSYAPLRVPQVELAWPRSIKGEGAGRDVGLVGEVFLGDAALLAELADRFAEGELRLMERRISPGTLSGASQALQPHQLPQDLLHEFRAWHGRARGTT